MNVLKEEHFGTKMAQDNPCCVFDFTFSAEGLEMDTIREFLKENCKKWSFQLEQGESGYLHYQGRVSMQGKKRLSYMIKHFSLGKSSRWSKTSNENRDNDFYVTKDESRVEGPWKDTDVARYEPRQVREITKWRPWQIKVAGMINVWDTRSIHLIVDEGGNIGKTMLALKLRTEGLACYIPYVKEYRDIMRMVMDQPKLGAYMIDLPRALKKDHQREMWAALETVKGGYAYDDRYHFKDEVFDSPNIFVFTNKLPDTEYMSTDRWKFWKVNNMTWELMEYYERTEFEFYYEMNEKDGEEKDS